MRLLRQLFTVLFLLMAFACKAQGDLLVTPKRLVFDGSKRTEEINLANIGKDSATYAISFVQYRMDENGAFVLLNETDTGYSFAHKNLRFFPRTVTLAPNEAQTIKVQLIKTNELAPGEYRSHLFFKNILQTEALGESQPAVKDSGISVRLKPSFGLSIATIIRIGEGSANATISNAIFGALPEPLLSFTLNRSGNFSLYGDVKVTHVSITGTATQVAIMKGLAVYTPNALRKIKIPLAKMPAVDYKAGKLLIEFTNPSVKNAVLAKTELEL